MGLRLTMAILATLGSSLAMGCDPQARTASGVARADVGGGAASRERESCGGTRDCEAGLRCLEGVCVKPAASRVADYHWAAGESAAAKGQHDVAAQAFALAMEKFPPDQVPASLLCAYGVALRRQG